MGKKLLFICSLFCLSQVSLAGEGQENLPPSKRPLSFRLLNAPNATPSASKFNVKIQPAFFWASVGLEAECVLSAKMSLALNIVGKYGQIDAKNNVHNLPKGSFLDNGYLVELIGRRFFTLNKRNLGLAPIGFYVQASVGYSKLLYFDGSVRPFSLHTRIRPSSSDVSDPSNFPQPQPFIGGIGVGYQIELLHNKVVGNISVGAQGSSDSHGIFMTLYMSPSLGMMF